MEKTKRGEVSPQLTSSKHKYISGGRKGKNKEEIHCEIHRSREREREIIPTNHLMGTVSRQFNLL